MNLPNKLTLIRIAMVPLFVGCFYLSTPHANTIAAIVFGIAYLTDLADGMIARKRNLVTDFGKLMDPIADKLLSCSALIMLSSLNMLSPIATVIIISREFVISALRQLSAGKGVVIAANWIGKAKTLTQCIGVILILLGNPGFNKLNFPFDQIIIWVSVVLSIWSGIDYTVKNIQTIDLDK